MVQAAPAHSWRRIAIATLAAYALALQTLLLALGGALHPVPAGVAPLCSPGGGASPPPSRGAPPPRAELCCLIACHGSALGGATAAPATAPRLALLGIAVANPEVAFALAGRKLRPVGSRAPPVAA